MFVHRNENWQNFSKQVNISKYKAFCRDKNVKGLYHINEKIAFNIIKDEEFSKLIKMILFHRPQACKFIKKETLAQVFSCEFCKILKNASFT